MELTDANLSSLIKFSKGISEILEKEDKKERSFNLIQAVVRGRLHETSHSRILGELLKYDSEILKSFLEDFVGHGLYIEKDIKVYIEKDNIDISIEGTGYTVIIENKVNNAPEQEAQIDRYVNYIQQHRVGKVYVLYISGEYPILPSEYSFNETKGKCEIKSLTFKKDIRDWVNELLAQDKSFSIHSALYHYKKYLDYIFDIGLNSEIPMKIKGQIINYLETSGKIEDEILALKELYNQLTETATACKKLEYEKTWEKIRSDINSELDKLGLQHLVSMQNHMWDLPDDGIEFSVTDFPNNKFYAVVSYLNQRYIGIINFDNNSSEKQLNNDIEQKFKKLLKGMESDKIPKSKIYSTLRYPYYFFVDNDDDLKKYYQKLVEILKNNKNIKIINNC